MSENVLLEIQQSARHTLSQGPAILSACDPADLQQALQHIQQHLAADAASLPLLTQLQSDPQSAAESLAKLEQIALQQLIEAISACFPGKDQPSPVKKLELLDFDMPEDSPADAEAAFELLALDGADAPAEIATDTAVTPALKHLLNLAAAVYFVHHVSE
ncbi:MAG: hypothetical protein IGS03_02330 [Candidatus Sericytochromatia bacterium]|nr:hypothetical protein [Candidatus Sericytochromatia bacterium]